MIKLDDKCKRIKDCVMQMANRVEQMYSLSLEIIESGDSEQALKVIQMDDFVNSAEEEINDLAIEALALLSPVASDLRKVITGIKISSNTFLNSMLVGMVFEYFENMCDDFAWG